MNLLSAWKLKASVWNRKRKLLYIKDRISDSDTVLDIGVAPASEVPLYETNYLDEYFLKNNRKFDALGLETEDFTNFRKRYTNCTLHTFDGMHFPAFAQPYDVVVSNAVVEHVGTREEQLLWLKNIGKLCRKLIITTPNRLFPVESHTNAVLKHIVSGRFQAELLDDHINLFSKKEFTDILEAAGYRILTVKKNRLLCMTMDFIVVCEPVG